MSNVLDMITRCGFEAHSITDNNALPCTLVRDGIPIGFLSDKFQVNLLPGHEAEQEQLSKAVGFAVENAGLTPVREGYILTQFKETALIAEYDFTAQRPVYSVYHHTDGKLDEQPLFASDGREAAAKYYSTASGLLAAQVDIPPKDVRWRNSLIGELAQAGYTLKEKTESKTRAFEILDVDGDIVAYISRDNKLSYVTSDTTERKTISNAYWHSNPDRERTPRAFERIRDVFVRRGMTARLIATPEGAEADVRKDGKNVGYVTKDQSVEVTEPTARTQIDRAMDGLRKNAGNTVRVQPAEDSKKEEKVNAHPTPERVPAAEKAEKTVEKKEEKSTDLTMGDMAEMLLAIVSIKGVRDLLSADLKDKINALIPAETEQPVEINTSEREADTQPLNDSQQQTLRTEFLKSYNLLQTVKGFNEEKEQAIGAQMIKDFGTADPKVFEANLAQGKYDIPKKTSRTLDEKLSEAKEQARVNHYDRAETQEKTKDVERGANE